MIPLSQLPPGTRARVINVASGAGGIRRLIYMGLLPGVEVTVVYNPGIGPIVVRFRGMTVSIGRGLANKILVEVLPP